MRRDDREFTAFVAARSPALRRTAYLLAGDWHEAEDLVQAALVKLYVAWPRVRADTADAYARKVVARAFLDARRRRSSTERPTQDMPDGPRTGACGSGPDARMDLMTALAALPARQRATVVLRYWHDLSVEQTARDLSVTEGTVKSQASKGLDALRAVLGPAYAKDRT